MLHEILLRSTCGGHLIPLMPKTHQLRKRESLYEDSTGVVLRAKDSSGHWVEVRKPKPEAKGRELPAVEFA